MFGSGKKSKKNLDYKFEKKLFALLFFLTF